jgi:acetolactate synthase-1/2/3 large subunit
MVNIVGDHASYHLALDAPLTSDIDSLARPMSNSVRRIAGPDDVGPTVEAAFRASLSPPGVSTIILPADAAWSAAGKAQPRKLQLDAPRLPEAATVRAVAEAIRARPGRAAIVVGGAAARADALDIAGRIASACKVRLFNEVLVAHTQRGRGRVAPARIPYPVDMALEVLRDVDVLVLVGVPEPVAFFAYPGKPGRLVHEGCAVLTLARHGEDLEGALQALHEELGVKLTEPLSPAAPVSDEGEPAGPLTGDAVGVMVARRLPENAIVVEESVTSTRRFFALSAFAAPHDYMMQTGGAIGGGIPMATGAAIACPDRKVINLQADGSGMYTVQGLWTQARERLDVTTVIFSNRTYAILHHEMKNVGVTSVGVNARRMLDLDDPPLDWVSLARGLGVEAELALTCERFAELFEAALKRKGPFLIEARV